MTISLDDLAALVLSASDAPRFRDEALDPALVDRLVATATVRPSGAAGEAPWRFLVVVGAELEVLIARIADALGRRWGLGAVRPRGLASEAVLRAPALVLVFSRVPASEGMEAVSQVVMAVQNVIVLAAAAGLATHRMLGANLVPEAVLEWAATTVDPEIRGGEFVAMLALGHGERATPPGPPGQPPEWVGLPGVPREPHDRALLAPPPPAQVLCSPDGERVLVAEPYDANRAQLSAVLSAAGYEVEAVADAAGLSRRGAAGTRPVSLFVLADNLPDAPGFELVRTLRAVPGRGAPIVVTTARRDSAFRIAGLAAGVDYYLRKPVNPIELYTAARILLEQHRRGEELARANDELSRLLAELRSTQARLVQQAKMASLGQLVAGVAHEVNTPLGAVVSNNDLFQRCFVRVRRRLDELGVGEDDKLERDLGAITDLMGVTSMAHARITNIVRELRVFARLDEADRKAIDLHEGLESTLVLINHLIKGRIDVIRDYAELPPIECHPNQLNQVFMNLLVNACQALGEGGAITLVTRHDPASQRIRVAISDTGPGIPSETLSRVFDPGFTTKGAGVGTGLGLSICYQIVEAHGGEITVDSTAGQGTTFEISLPIESRPLPSRAPSGS
jgi:signal transduction histidine kinase/nitroreductase